MTASLPCNVEKALWHLQITWKQRLLGCLPHKCSMSHPLLFLDAKHLASAAYSTLACHTRLLSVTRSAWIKMKARFFEFNPDRSQARRPHGKDPQASTAASRTMRHQSTQEQQQQQWRRRQQILPNSGSAGRSSETRRSRMYRDQRMWPEHNTRTKRIQRPRQHIKIKIKISYQRPQQQWYTTRESCSAMQKQVIYEQ